MSSLNEFRDEVNEAQIGYYATRISDETEVLWRADYATADHLRFRAGDAHDVGTAAAWRGEADRIARRWRSDAEIGARWEQLEQMQSELPELFVHAPTHPDLPIAARPASMDAVSWRSQMQAMQLEGFGVWPDPGEDRINPHNGRTTFEPRSWDRSDPTNPNHYVGAASHDERVMRADFARFHQLRAEAGSEVLDEERAQDAEDMRERIGLRWSVRGDALGEEFRVMSGLTLEYEGDPQRAAAAAAEIRNTATAPEIKVRSAEQVRELTGPEPERVGARSALAGHRSRNALTRGSDRDGFDR